MVRFFLFTVQMILLIAAGLWIFNRPGTIAIHWLGYDIEAHIGVAFIALVTFVLALLFVNKIIGWIAALPRRLMGLRGRKRRGRGFQSLTIGLSAVAAGDSRLASYHAYRMRQFLPDEKGLPWLLEAQAAKLRGEDGEAKIYFEKLLKDKDTAFMGVRGLLTAAIESADVDSALELARQALVMHPAQSWIIRTVFGLEVQKHAWAAALTTLKKGERAKAWTPEEIKSNRVAILLQQGEELHRGGYQGEATRKFKDAHRINPGFTPAALALAQDYISHQKRRAAVAVIERSWKENPHPDLVPVWDALSPPNKANDVTVRLRWFERLVALNPASAESQIAAARATIDERMWGEAWQYLTAAEKIRPDARLYRMWAQMEEKTDHSESAKRYWEKAAAAAPDQVWSCSETGRIYERWMPIAEPHGAFNTIQWGYPHARDGVGHTRLTGANDIVIEPVLSITSKV